MAGVSLRRVLLLAVLVLAALSLAPGSGAGDGRVAVIVTFKGKPRSADIATLRGAGAEIAHVYGIVPAVAATVPRSALAKLAASAGVRRVERDGTVTALDYRSTHDWGIGRIRADVVHGNGNTGTGVRVAVVDSGIDCEHAELDANCIFGPSYVDGTTSSDDDNGHGTHVGGTVAAEVDDVTTGVVGVAPSATVVAYKVLDEDAVGSWSNVIKAIDHIWNGGDKRAEVVNMSLGGRRAPGALESALNRAYASGIVLVAAAGNGGKCAGKGDNLSYPARYASVIAVAATQEDDTRACFSATGSDLELSAPGVSVFSTWPEDRSTSAHNPQPVCEALICHYKYGSGTSMSSPHAAGAAALVIAAGIVSNDNGENGIADEVRQRLNETAKDLGAAGRDSQYGYGLVDAAAATGL